MSIKEGEEWQMNKIKELGLKRRVEHFIYAEPKVLNPEANVKNHREIIGETKVVLVLGDEGEFDDGEIVAVGQSYCSSSDKNYNKQKGRIIATARALRKVAESG